MTVKSVSSEHETIRTPASIQPHGFLVAIDTLTQRISRASANTPDFLARPIDALLGAPWREALGNLPATLHKVLTDGPYPQQLLLHASQRYGQYHFDISSHSSGGELILEFERRDSDDETSPDSLYPQMRAALELIQSEQSLEALYGLTASSMRELTGFDRVLVYRFDGQWNGTVVGESRTERLPSYIDLHFTAMDIPAQVREIYRLNRIRLIADADCQPVPILSHDADAPPLDLSYSVLRSVSPAHLKYIRHMQAPASMSVSILVAGQLWGLVSCHHSTPRQVPAQVRTACDFLAQVVSMQLTSKQRSADAAERVGLQSLQAELLSRMAQEKRFVGGLTARPAAFMGLTDAQGAAVVLEHRCFCVGKVPDRPFIFELADWLAKEHTHEELFVTDKLATRYPASLEHAASASGLLAISISQSHRSYVMWFRPEVVQTVNWGGDPRQPADPRDDARHPRKSFAVWQETLRLRSLPWTAAQVDMAASLRHAIIGIIMRNAEELADLSDELRRSNKELEAFSYSVSHDLRAPFRHIVGYAELLKELDVLRDQPHALRYVETIIESAHTAGRLVDGLLDFSQVGRAALARDRVDIDKVVVECQRLLEPDTRGRDISWRIDKLGSATGDASMLRQVFQNLLSNAIKYSRGREPAMIHVRREKKGANLVYAVSDNGVGFDMHYVGKLFGVFQRLHRLEEFEGTGIGLANVKRIAERHGGSVWAEGEPGRGATFYFSIPDQAETA